MLNRNPNKKIQESLDELIEKARIENGQAVYLNIYHMSYANYIIQLLGFGFFQTTIEVNKIEYSFTPTEDDNSGIVFNNLGEGKKDIWLKEKIYLGNTIYDDDEIKQLLFLNIPYWLGKSYDPFLKNSNHFTKFLASILLRVESIANYPLYVNRIIEYGIFLNGFYSPIKRLNQENKIKNEENKSSNESEVNQINDISITFNNQENSNNDYNKDDKNEINDIKLDVDNNKNNLNLKLIPRKNQINDSYFKRGIEKNIFLRPIIYTGNNDLLRKLFEADYLLITEKKFTQALNFYQYLLKEIDKDKNLYLEFNNCFSIENTQYPIDENSKHIDDKNLILKLKILHCIYYIFYVRDFLYDEEIVAKTIQKLNNKDFYSFFYLSIVNLKQGKIDECYQMIKDGIEICNDIQFKEYFFKFKLFLETNHNCG